MSQRNIGDVTRGEDGMLYVTTLDNSGKPTWTCMDVDDSLQAILISMLKTIKWSAYYHNTLRGPSDVFQKNDWQGGAVAATAAASVSAAASSSKRKKTIYNQHIGGVLRSLAQNSPNMPRRERMRIAVETWKKISSAANNDADKREASSSVLHAMSSNAQTSTNAYNTPPVPRAQTVWKLMLDSHPDTPTHRRSIDNSDVPYHGGGGE